MSQITLASGSASRRALLSGAGVQAECIKPNVDEESAKASFRADGMSVRDQAMRLAEMKAMKVSAMQGGLMIGGDQMLSLRGEAFDKPEGFEGARSHLRALSGETHILETAIVIAENGQPVWRHHARPRLTMRDFDDAFIDHYLQTADEAILDTVGAYRLEGLGAQLFSKIEGDYFAILGLPLFPLLDYLRTRGVIEA